MMGRQVPNLVHAPTSRCFELHTWIIDRNPHAELSIQESDLSLISPRGNNGRVGY